MSYGIWRWVSDLLTFSLQAMRFPPAILDTPCVERSKLWSPVRICGADTLAPR